MKDKIRDGKEEGMIGEVERRKKRRETERGNET